LLSFHISLIFATDPSGNALELCDLGMLGFLCLLQVSSKLLTIISSPCWQSPYSLLFRQ